MRFTWKKILVLFGLLGIVIALSGFGYSEMKKSFREREAYILKQNEVLRSKLAIARQENESIKKSIEEDYEEVTTKDGTKTIRRKTKTRVEIEREVRERITREYEKRKESYARSIREQVLKEYTRKTSLVITGGGYVDMSMNAGYMGQISYVTPWNPVSISAGAMSDGRFTLGLGLAI